MHNRAENVPLFSAPQNGKNLPLIVKFCVCGVKTTTLEWTLKSPVAEHTFSKPPFFVTAGEHYADYRPGSNRIGVSNSDGR